LQFHSFHFFLLIRLLKSDLYVYLKMKGAKFPTFRLQFENSHGFVLRRTNELITFILFSQSHCFNSSDNNHKHADDIQLWAMSFVTTNLNTDNSRS
jgi:hypothetical protein